MADAESTTSVEETLAWEAEQRPRAGLAGVLAGVLTLLSGVMLLQIFKSAPRVPLVDALRDAMGLPLPGREGLRSALIQFYDDKAVLLLIAATLLAIGTLLTGLTLAYLYRAARARKTNVPVIAYYSAIVSAVVAAVTGIATQIAVAVLAHQFVTGSDKSSVKAHDALTSAAILIPSTLRALSTVGLALSFVIIAVNAMRVGLLTRFMGILGVIVGVLFVLPIGSQLPIVQCFWLVAVGLLILRRWPGGNLPPAWETGRAEPWPTQLELREARERAGAVGGPVPPAGAPDAPDAEATPAQPARRKRKRR
jgi:hypothetical protein